MKTKTRYICLYNPDLLGRFITVIKVPHEHTTHKEIHRDAAIWVWEAKRSVGCYDPNEVSDEELFDPDGEHEMINDENSKWFQVNATVGKYLEGERPYGSGEDRVVEALREDALWKCDHNRTRNGINNDRGTLVEYPN